MFFVKSKNVESIIFSDGEIYKYYILYLFLHK